MDPGNVGILLLVCTIGRPNATKQKQYEWEFQGITGRFEFLYFFFLLRIASVFVR